MSRGLERLPGGGDACFEAGGVGRNEVGARGQGGHSFKRRYRGGDAQIVTQPHQGSKFMWEKAEHISSLKTWGWILRSLECQTSDYWLYLGRGALEKVTYFSNLPTLLLRQESFKLISRWIQGLWKILRDMERRSKGPWWRFLGSNVFTRPPKEAAHRIRGKFVNHIIW